MEDGENMAAWVVIIICAICGISIITSDCISYLKSKKNKHKYK